MPAKANHAAAEQAGIPAGYSIKNWAPGELPCTLLGSVFDGNSLGKWIFDWTVFEHGGGSPMADMAGDLWLLLIELVGKLKSAEERIDWIRADEQRDMVGDFLCAGDRLWQLFKDVLAACEPFMLSVAKLKDGQRVVLGDEAGREFVASIFGRERLLEETEKLMSKTRLWIFRFDVNCEEVLRHLPVRRRRRQDLMKQDV